LPKEIHLEKEKEMVFVHLCQTNGESPFNGDDTDDSHLNAIEIGSQAARVYECILEWNINIGQTDICKRRTRSAVLFICRSVLHIDALGCTVNLPG